MTVREDMPMNKGSIVLLMISCLLLCGCAEKDAAPDSTAATSAPAGTASAAPVSEAESSNEEKTMRITADAKGYNDGIFTFEYGGREYSLPLDADKFANTNPHLTDIGINEKIINNRFDIPVKADMEITQDMTEIVRCDVETANGARYLQDDIGTVYHMYPYKGSVYRIASDENTFYVDLNAFNNLLKAVPSEDTEVGFDGVILDNDKLITDRLLAVAERRLEADEDGQSGISHIGLGNTLKYHYLGTVISAADDKAVIKLNYTGREITVPAFLRDGEIKEGAEAAVTLDDTPEELAASEEPARDHAVLFTDIKPLLPEGAEFNDLAYFKSRPGSCDPPYDFTTTDTSSES